MVEDYSGCTACPLYIDAKGYVGGVGPKTARIMLVGEGPGREEERKGVPFVGRVGKRLDTLLKLTPWQRGDVYLTNVLKHRTSVTNRKPKVSEVRACSPILLAELDEVRPEVIVTLGDTAAKFFDPTIKLEAKDHGLSRRISFHGRDYILVPMYHPAFSLHNPSVYAEIIQDFKRLHWEVEHVDRPDVPVYPVQTGPECRAIVSPESIIGFDLETTAPLKGTKRKRLDVTRVEIIGYSYATAGGEAGYVVGPPHDISPLLGGMSVAKVCHHAGFEFGVLRRAGITLDNYEDTKLAAYLLGHRNTGLKSLSRQVLGVDPISYDEIADKEVGLVNVPPDEIAQYAAPDAINALGLWRVFEPELKRFGLDRLYYDVELPCVPVLVGMEERGVGLDTTAARAVLEELELALEHAAVDACVAGLGRYSVSSNDEVARGLEALGAPLKKRTESKRLLITDEATLMSVRAWNPTLIDAILAYRGIRKLIGYVNSYLDLVGEDARLHPDWNQAGHVEELVDLSAGAPVTGRLSCSAPNLQQVPHHGVDAGWESKIRGLIVARPGHILVSGDISQEEPRIAALITRDKQLNADFAAGVPIYAPIGEQIYGKPIGKHTHPKEWHEAKTVFLALCYGADFAKLIEIVPTLSVDDAKRIMRALHERYAGLTSLVSRTAVELRANGFIRDIFGRVRWFPAYFTSDRQEALRQAVNFKIQGPGGTIIKRCLKRVDDALPGSIIMCIHDDITLEVPVEREQEARRVLTEMTEGMYPGLVLPVDVHAGTRWSELG